MKLLLLALMFHERDDPFRSDIIDALQFGSRVAIFNVYGLRVNINFNFVVDDGLGKQLCLMFLLGQLVFLTSISVLRV